MHVTQVTVMHHQAGASAGVWVSDREALLKPPTWPRPRYVPAVAASSGQVRVRSDSSERVWHCFPLLHNLTFVACTGRQTHYIVQFY